MKPIRFILLKDIPWFKVWFIYELWIDSMYKDNNWKYITWRYTIDDMRYNTEFFKEF